MPFYLALIALVGLSLFTVRVYKQLDQLRALKPWMLAEKRDKAFPFVVDAYGFKYQGESSNLIDEEVLVFGAFEKERLFFMRDYLANCGTAAPVVLDVGANTGHHSLFLSRHAGRVHSFEPSPDVIRRFKHNLSLNPEIKNVVLHEVGLGKEEAELPFLEPPAGNHGTGTFRVEGATGDRKVSGQKLHVVVGDDWLRGREAGPVALLKMDIEGFEEAALLGLQGTLRQHRPLVVVEVSSPSTNGTIGSLEQLRKLLPERYEFLMLEGREVDGALKGDYQLHPLTEAEFRAGRQVEVVAYPAERASQV
ncbi:MAG: FkbM family methyltransferase, partial [Gemmataceae bacterium]